MRDAPAGRRAGLLIPLFSCPSTNSWGIGEIGDLVALTEWLAAGGQSALQLLPINEMAPDQHSPYSAMSAMAIDPIYISLALVPDFQGEASLSAGDQALLARVRQSAAIDYDGVRRLKRDALRTCYERFVTHERNRDTDRSRAFAAFLSEQAWWIDDYAVFRAVRARYGVPWTEWPEAIRRRDPAALADARRPRERAAVHQCLQSMDSPIARGSLGAINGSRRALLSDLALHGGRRQRRRLGTSGSVQARCHRRRASRCLQRGRPGLGHAGLQVGHHLGR
jgi:4-alpha-glucanotransferase